MNKYPLLSKTLIVGFLMLLLVIPLSMVRDVVNERSANREAAARDIANASAGEQTVVGPVLYVPFTETFPVTVPVPNTKDETRVEMRTRKSASVVFPTRLDIQSQLKTEVRWRGIFPVTVFTTEQSGQGRFLWKEVKPEMKDGQVSLGRPVVLLGVSDVRGLLSAPRLGLGDQQLPFGPTPLESDAPLPLAAEIDADALKPGADIAFTLRLELAGTERLGWVPLANENTVTLASSWPHPSFSGSFLPRTRQVTADGFEASWSVPALSSQAQKQFLHALVALTETGATGAPQADSTRASPTLLNGSAMEQFSVSLDDPVDVYRLTDRATKYGMMFIVLTFAVFFALEMVKRWRIHPMQYLMIGAALVLFFLLLLSLSEHASFAMAYAVASGACIALLTYYLRYVLGGWRAGLGMSGMLVALYGVLYGILASEDNALVMGSLLLFGVLASIMVATRKLDWYGVMNLAPAATAKPDDSPAAVVQTNAL